MPKPKFPLWLHSSGQWAKKFHGTYYYFGRDKQAAEARYHDEWPRIKAGLPRFVATAPDPRGPTLAVVCNRFLHDRKQRVDAGELAPGSWRNYHLVCRVILQTLGRNTPAASLQPPDYGRLRAALAAGLGPNTLTLRIGLCKAVFRFGSTLTEKIPRYGDQFKGPPMRARRLHAHARAPRLLDAGQLRAILKAADVPMRAMILLGLNCGYGAMDVAELRDGELAKRSGWMSMPRHKTGEQRRCPLWPETVKALDAAWQTRPKPKDDADADRLFLTDRGCPVVVETPIVGGKPGGRSDAVLKGWRDACRAAGVETPKGSGFYVLRHCFRTVADEVKDPPACDLIMGHSDPSMAAAYRESISDERLEAVTDHVREWCFGKRPAQSSRAATKKPKN